MAEREISNTTEPEDPTKPHQTPEDLRKLREEIYKQKLREFSDKSGVIPAKEPRLTPLELGDIDKTN